MKRTFIVEFFYKSKDVCGFTMREVEAKNFGEACEKIKANPAYPNAEGFVEIRTQVYVIP